MDASAVACDRAKFFDIPCASAPPPMDIEHPPEEQRENDVIRGPKSLKTSGCQTVYREGSAQTVPYFPTPRYRRGAETPELLLIADLIKGDGEPGRVEADIVLRARKRRNWEKMLQQIADGLIEPNERQLILEAIEWEQWLAREEEIEDEQSQRLDYVQQALNERSELNAIDSMERLNESMGRMAIEHDRDLAIVR